MYWSMDRLFSRCIMNVFCMYLELASTACMRCGDTWIMCGSHNTRPTCGIRPKYILIHDQIHVSVRGVSSPNWGGIMTIPRPTDRTACLAHRLLLSCLPRRTRRATPRMSSMIATMSRRPAAGYSSSRGKVWEERDAPTKALTLQPGDRTHICRAGATAQLRAVSPWEADALPSHWTLAPSLALWAG